MSLETQFINCRQCIAGKLVEMPMTIDARGFIIPNSPLLIAPGFIELQTNGALGFHFSHYTCSQTYSAGVQKLAKYLPSTGVTAFYPTIPTVSSSVFQSVLPYLAPQDIEDGASVLGAHVEGPFLAPSKKGAHDAANMHIPESSSLESIYGVDNLSQSIKILTLAPELPGAVTHISKLKNEYGIRVSMGHSAATHAEGLAGINAGASLLTHTFNAMAPLHHREPGLAGLISLPSPQAPYFSLIADGIHLHPSIISLAYRASPQKCILITDFIELSGLPDGIYPGHAQIPHQQRKEGNRVTIEGTETLIGTSVGMDECVRNLVVWAGIGVEEAVMCVSENVARVMGVQDRGKLEVGRRGDFVVLDEGGVKETWVLGRKVFEKGV